jgi:tRNA dimethylallyltransferase
VIGEQAAGGERPAPIVLAGPTASGKSELVLSLAESLGAEIISVDSMQVYRGLDIGSAKPSLDERSRVPHHLIDVAELDEPFSAGHFVRLAEAAIARLAASDKRAILCGGTGLYFSALREGLAEAPPADSSLRLELEAATLDALLAELGYRDPRALELIDRQNRRRVVRAVEIVRTTGRPWSEQRENWGRGANRTDGWTWIGLHRDREDLLGRIDLRVERMFAAGLVDETRELLSRGLEANRTAMQAIGYRQVVEHLRGAKNLGDTIELVKIRTRQFSKRQMTWFRKFLPLDWLEAGRSESVDSLACRAMARVRERELKNGRE